MSQPVFRLCSAQRASELSQHVNVNVLPVKQVWLVWKDIQQKSHDFGHARPKGEYLSTTHHALCGKTQREHISTQTSNTSCRVVDGDDLGLFLQQQDPGTLQSFSLPWKSILEPNVRPSVRQLNFKSGQMLWHNLRRASHKQIATSLIK